MGAVEGAEAQLQTHHCLWAIEFNLGQHTNCVAAVEQGLALYLTAGGHESLTLYGGHDPRVCGLGQAGLSLWFQGFPARAIASVNEALEWAKTIKHVGSLAHAYDIAAMLHRYRQDLGALGFTIGEMKRLARTHRLPSLSAKALIFEGWRLAKLGHSARGRTSADEGYKIQCEIGTREDFPVYADMRAEILALCGEWQEAIDVIDAALEEVERTKHRYWAAELYRRRADLLRKLDHSREDITSALQAAMSTALNQGATTLFFLACKTAIRLDEWPTLSGEFGHVLDSFILKQTTQGEMAELCSEVEKALRNGAAQAQRSGLRCLS